MSLALFQLGDFTLASGRKSRWKIECDNLLVDDWQGLAAIAAEILPPFTRTIGVPRGGVIFANALAMYGRPNQTKPVLVICEDVVTTGGSMEKFKAELLVDPTKTLVPGDKDTIGSVVATEYEIIGVTAFARGKPPEWVIPLFQMPEPRHG